LYRVNFVKRQIVNILGRKGYKLVPKAPEEYLLGDMDIVSLLIGRSFPRSVVVNVPLDRCRGFYWFPLNPDSHPFSATISFYSQNPTLSYEESPLFRYYEQCQPAAAIDVLGVRPGEATGFANLEPLAYCMPWLEGSPTNFARTRHEIARHEALRYGLNVDESDGTTMFGPVSRAKGELEYRRLIEIYESMREHGYMRHSGPDGDVGGTLLLDADSNWRIYIAPGHHRIAAAAVLGLETVPVRIGKSPVRIADCHLWPQVMAGRITADAARILFRRIIDGAPPPIFNWLT
jgi:hypothetical protein